MYKSLKEAKLALDSRLIKDRFKLHKKLQSNEFSKVPSEQLENLPSWQTLTQHIAQSLQQVEQRKALVPNIEYDLKLPVATRKDELVELIKNHQKSSFCFKKLLSELWHEFESTLESPHL